MTFSYLLDQPSGLAPPEIELGAPFTRPQNWFDTQACAIANYQNPTITTEGDCVGIETIW